MTCPPFFLPVFMCMFFFVDSCVSGITNYTKFIIMPTIQADCITCLLQNFVCGEESVKFSLFLEMSFQSLMHIFCKSIFLCTLAMKHEETKQMEVHLQTKLVSTRNIQNSTHVYLQSIQILFE